MRESPKGREVGEFARTLPAEPTRVTLEDARVLRVAAALFQSDSARVDTLLRTSATPATTIHDGAAQLLSDTLTKGVVTWVMRRGGLTGRIWERSALPTLHFSSNTILWLFWLVSEPLADGRHKPFTLAGPLTIGDQLFALVCSETLGRTEFASSVLSQPMVQQGPLPWLFFSGMLARFDPSTPPLIEVHHLALLEALAPFFVDQIVHQERSKQHMPLALGLRLGEVQQAVWTNYLDLLEHHDLRTRAAVFLKAANILLPALSPNLLAQRWVLAESRDASLARRSEAQHSVATLFRVLGRLENWRKEAASVRFVDDDFERSQQVLRHFEVLDLAGFSRAKEIYRLLTALPSVVS